MPSHLRFITMTGVDEATNLEHIAELSDQFPFAEWGILFDPRKAGNSPRHPSLAFIERFSKFAQERGLHASLHLCGPIVKELVNTSDLDDATHPIFRLARQFGRVQLNVNLKNSNIDPLDMQALMRALTSRNEMRTRVVVQHHRGNESFTRHLLNHNEFDVLLDESGGRGVRTETWPDLPWLQFLRPGFAGGITPDNIGQVFESIRALPLRSAFWVDMEQGVRDANDQFDLAKCKAALQAGQLFVSAENLRASTLPHLQRNVLVEELSPLWLHWWSAKAMGYDVVVPPPEASAGDGDLVFSLDRQSGAWHRVSLTRHHEELTKEFHALDFSFEPLANGQWLAKFGHSGVRGRTLFEAGLRAIVREAYGMSVSFGQTAQEETEDS